MATTTPSTIDKLKSTLLSRFKSGLGKAKNLVKGTVNNMKGAGARWDKIQADKNENYLNSLLEETKDGITNANKKSSSSN